MPNVDIVCVKIREMKLGTLADSGNELYNDVSSAEF
jgi:hypothetical protein